MNLSETVTVVSTEQAMSSVPPQIGAGGQPRYSQHMERDRPGAPGMGYGGPPPPPGSYGNVYSSYPPPPYGNSMHGSYSAPGAIPGQAPLGYPRPGYSVPPHSSAYGPGYGPSPGTGSFPQSVHHPPYYGGGYESHYGGQPPPGHPSHPQGPQSSYRGASPVPPQSTGSSVLRGPNSGLPTVPSSTDQHALGSASSAMLPKKSRSPQGASKSSADGKGKNNTSQPLEETIPQHKLPDHGEVERLRAAAATEITTEEVKPIQTDFHFFVKEHIETHRKLAEEEIRSGMDDESEKLDPILVNSNLNTRLMRAWEGLTKESREAYMEQEEADRRRFMEDDEIASRHCATLTARGKSPRAVGNDNKDNVRQQKLKKQPQQEAGDAPKTAGGTNNEEKKNAEPIKDESKRPAPESTGEPGGTSGAQESPLKKNKVGI